METVVAQVTERVAAFMDEHGMTHPGDTVLACVSGGPDSVCLLRLLRDIGARQGFGVAALHVEHGIRGAASAGDMDFTRALCAELNVPLRVERADVPAVAEKNGQSLEVAAREARKEAAGRALTRFGARLYATGHHLDDQLETVLLHITRGAGLSGLRGMLPVNGACVRPLLCLSRAQVMGYLEALGAPYRVDETNAQAFTPRNALRARVTGALYDLNPALPGAVARMTETLRVDAEALDALAHEAFKVRFDGGALDIREWRGVPEAVRRRVLMLTAAALGGKPEHAHIRALDAAALAGRGGLSMPGATLEAGYGSLRVVAVCASFEEIELRPPCEVSAGAGVVSARFAPPPFGPLNQPHVQYFDARALEGKRLTLRPYREGERVRPFGGGHHRLVSDIFTDLKIPAHKRAATPLLCLGGEVLWIAGVRRCAGAEIDDDTGLALVVQYNEMRNGHGSGQ